jgi:hypothetical protein
MTCYLCGKAATAPNLVLAKGTPLHIGCLVDNWRQLREACNATVLALNEIDDYKAQDVALKLAMAAVTRKSGAV